MYEDICNQIRPALLRMFIIWHLASTASIGHLQDSIQEYERMEKVSTQSVFQFSLTVRSAF